MSNSPLVSYTKLSPNHSGRRTKKIDTITIHCMAGNLSVETCGNLFASSSRQASSNYGVGTDGRIALYVDEANRSWCTSSNANDQRAVTIEVANNGGAPDWPVSAKAYAALLDLVTDICKRNGIKRLVWSTNKTNRVNHLNGCNMTVHRDYAAKACPGNYLYKRHGEIAAEVNRRLGATGGTTTGSGQSSGTGATGLKVGDEVEFTGTKHYTSATAAAAKSCKPGKAKVTAVAAGKAHPYHLKAITGSSSTVYGWVNAADIKAEEKATSYRIRVTTGELNIRKGPGTNYGTNGSIKDKGIYTITAEADGPGASKWGKLKSGAGWISLDYTAKV